MKEICILAPVYNEEKGIEKFCQEVQKHCQPLTATYQIRILLVVDQCTDHTDQVVNRLTQEHANISAIFLSSRFGHQNSLLAGIDHCTSDVLIMMDSDLQHPPALIPEMVARYEEGNDIVYTTKRVNKGETKLVKRLITFLFYRFLRLISDTPIKPHAADFRLIDRKVVNVFRNQLRERNFFLRGLISWVGFKQCEVFFDTQKRFAGTSNYQFKHLASLALKGILSFSNKPLRTITLVGIAASTISFLLILHSLLGYFLSSETPAGWTSIAIMLSFFSGLQLFLLGIVGEYIGAIYYEVKNRPHYIVANTLNLKDVDDHAKNRVVAKPDQSKLTVHPSPV